MKYFNSKISGAFRALKIFNGNQMTRITMPTNHQGVFNENTGNMGVIYRGRDKGKETTMSLDILTIQNNQSIGMGGDYNTKDLVTSDSYKGGK